MVYVSSRNSKRIVRCGSILLGWKYFGILFFFTLGTPVNHIGYGPSYCVIMLVAGRGPGGGSKGKSPNVRLNHDICVKCIIRPLTTPPKGTN